MMRAPLTYLMLSLFALYLGERVMTPAQGMWVSGVGAALYLVSVAMGVLRVMRATAADRRQAARHILIAYLGVGVGLIVYGLLTHVLVGSLSPQMHAILSVTWPALVAAGLLPCLSMEMALQSMAQAPKLEMWRLNHAARAASIAVLALVAFGFVNFAASQRNHKIDVSYFKVTKPGESTIKLVESITEPVEMMLFYATGNDVLQYVQDYAEMLASHNPKFQVSVVDQALEPELAKKYKARNNGNIVMRNGDRSSTLTTGDDMEDAKRNLRKLDTEINERLLEILKPARTVYFTTGHGERDWQQADADTRLSFDNLKDGLENLGINVKRLGLGEGLATDVPKDASAVIIGGPTELFLEQERASLQRYINGGGRVFAMFDPDHGVADNALIAPYGIQVEPGLVAIDRYNVRLQGQGDSRYNFATTRTLTHTSVKTLNENLGRMGVVFLGTGSLSKTEDAKKMKLNDTYAPKFPLMSMPEAWVDANSNQKMDAPAEKVGIANLLGAVEIDKTKEGGGIGRLLVAADADFAGTGVVAYPGNAAVILDGIRWLLGDELLAGKVETEEDIAIVHRKEEDTALFYGTSFLVPASVLGFGLLYTRRTRKGRGA